MSLIPVFSWVIAATVRASLLVLVVLTLQRVLRSRLSARWKYALWTPVLLAVLIPAQPLIPYWARPITDESETHSRADSASAMVAGLTREEIKSGNVHPVDELIESEMDGANATPVSFGARPLVDEGAEVAFGGEGEIEVSKRAASSWQAIVAAGWLLGALCFSIAVWVSHTAALWRVRRRAISVDGSDLGRIESIAKELGLRKTPHVVLSPEVKAPAVCGALRPMLLLNEGFFQLLSREEADFVLRHELMHIRRGDVWVNFVLFGLAVIHWFNPLLWFAFFRAAADREAACDEDVLHAESPARRVAYGKTLLRMESELSPPGLCLGFIGIVQNGKCIRERIHFISDPKRMGIPARLLVLLSICVITLLGIAKSAETEPQTQQPLSAKEHPADTRQRTNEKTPIAKQSDVGYRLLTDKDRKLRTVEVISKDNVRRLIESGKAKKEEFSSIQELSKLRDLRRLKVVYGSHLSGDDLKRISKLPHIVELEIGFPSIASEYVEIDGDLAPLGQLKTLEVVRLCKDGICDEDLRFITELPRLHTLEFRADNGKKEDVRCTDKCAEYLVQAKLLQHLTIHGDSFTEDFSDMLSQGQSRLKTLELNSLGFTDESLLPIGTKNEILKLQGNWQVIAMRIGAKPATKESFTNKRVLIEGNAISMNGSLERLFQYRIDETSMPKKIDIPTEREPLKAIYRLDGDNLQLCIPQPEGSERPTSFDALGTNISMTLERMNP